MHVTHGTILFLAGLAAGAINSVAGGGSFIAFPALLFVGIPPVNANASNAVAVWPGQAVSIGAYRSQFRNLSWSTMTPLIITAVLGGVLGGWTLLKTPQAMFMHMVPWLILAATIVFTMSGRVTRWVRQRTASGEHHEFSNVRAVSIQIFIAFYIGYFGAGAGILILAMLALLGMDEIHTMNALKALLTTVSNGVALVLFVIAHAVYWPETIVMAVGTILGGYFGAYFAQKTKPEYVRAIVIVIGFVLSFYYFARQIWR